MGLKQQIINLLSDNKIKNGVVSGSEFLKNGSKQNSLYADFSEVKITDEDMYRGYTYAAIQKRANRVAQLGKENLTTKLVEGSISLKDEVPKHPYLKLIQESTNFTEKQFWKNISIYLDLVGVYYLGALRGRIQATEPGLSDIYSDIKDFVLLNPYEIKRVKDPDGNIGGYLETRKSDNKTRTWPAHMIIEIKELNPFDNQKEWAMTDAAKDSIFSINQAADYQRNSMAGNLNAPGILTTDIVLPKEDFENFVARIRQHQSGEPIIGNGSGSVNWQSMSNDLDGNAMVNINEINRNTLFAVSGTSKTVLGIEESGTTRDTARVQSDNFISNSAQPRVEDIIDFLNLDYKQKYPREFAQYGYIISLSNPLSKDYDTSQKALELRRAEFDFVSDIVSRGYTIESATQYANGDIDFIQLQKDTTTPLAIEAITDKPEEQETEDGDEDSVEEIENNEVEDIVSDDYPLNIIEKEEPQCCCENDLDTYYNDLSDDDKEELKAANKKLTEEIKATQKKAINFAIENVTINNFEESDIISNTEKESLIDSLIEIIKNYWWIVLPLFAKNITSSRNNEFDTNHEFIFSNEIQNKILENASHVANGHIQTILRDILSASNKSFDKVVEKAAAELILDSYKKNPDKFSTWFKEEPTIRQVVSKIEKTDILEQNRKIYDRAYKMAQSGYDRATITKAIRKEYNHLSKQRVDLIVRNETSRAFAQSQYQADYQFLNSIGQLQNAYKELYSQTGDPCEWCQAIIEKGPIPFTKNFLDKNEELTIEKNGETRTFIADYEDISSGVVHPNCHCAYRLIIKNANTSEKYDNAKKGNPYHDKLGRFTSGPSGGTGSSSTSGSSDKKQSVNVSELTEKDKAGNTTLSESSTQKQAKEIEKSIGKKEFEKRGEALDEYQGAAYYNINRYLRGDVKRQPKEIKDYLSTLDSACSSTSDKDFTVYRGGGNSTYKAVKGIKVGDVMPDNFSKSFVSSSLDKSIATDSFAVDDKNVVFEINVKKGAKFSVPSIYTNYGHEESEVILGRGQKYTIRSIKEDGNNMYVKLDMEKE